MSRTVRRRQRHWYAHEQAPHRRAWLKRQRASTRRRVKKGDYTGADRDDRRTQGWLTW